MGPIFNPLKHSTQFLYIDHKEPLGKAKQKFCFMTVYYNKIRLTEEDKTT